MDRETVKLAYDTGVLSLSEAIKALEPRTEYCFLWEAYKAITGKTDNDEVYEFHDCLVDLGWTQQFDGIMG